MSIETRVYPDEATASRAAAEAIAAAGQEAVAARGEFTLALSGGRTPWSMIATLGDMEEMPWEETRLFQVDERIAPPGDEARNLTQLVQTLSIAHQSTVRPMPVTSRDLELSAAEYEAHLPDPIDLVHLGLGPDGHTASLIPGDSVLEERERRVVITDHEYEGHRRMTVTYPALANAGKILWLTLGEKVREPLALLLESDPRIPAGMVENDDMLVIADEAAMGDAAAGAAAG